MLTWINAGCDVGLGLPKCQAMHPTSVLGQKQTSAVHWVECALNGGQFQAAVLTDCWAC